MAAIIKIVSPICLALENPAQH
uniref:Uncharacterized protein n=1 Tax=Rhizophora mucronata TaxID=61149 RepID=A0A2P2PXF7_RHIMU